MYVMLAGHGPPCVFCCCTLCIPAHIMPDVSRPCSSGRLQGLCAHRPCPSPSHRNALLHSPTPLAYSTSALRCVLSSGHLSIPCMSAGGGPADRPCRHRHALLHTPDKPWRNAPELSVATPAAHTFCCMQVVDLQPGSMNTVVLELEEVLGHRFIEVNSPEASSCCLGAPCLDG